MVTYLADGGFLDRQTEAVELEFATICPDSNRASVVRFTFDFQVEYVWRRRTIFLKKRSLPLSSGGVWFYVV
jgi:hypothetical protein